MAARPDIKNRRAFTLTELAIVLGVIGTIISAIWWAGSNANEMRKENAAFNELQTVLQNMLSLYQGQSIQNCSINPNVRAIDITACMISAQVIPNTYINSANPTWYADQPWSAGNFVIYANVDGPKTFRLSFYNVTFQGCIALINQATACQLGQSACPLDIITQVGGMYFGPAAANAGGWQTAATATNVNDWCQTNSYSGGANSVEFDYSL